MEANDSGSSGRRADQSAVDICQSQKLCGVLGVHGAAVHGSDRPRPARAPYSFRTTVRIIAANLARYSWAVAVLPLVPMAQIGS